LKPEFKQLLQIGIIVRDLVAAVNNYQELGIGPWEILSFSNSKGGIEDLKFNGEVLTEKGEILKIALLQRYGLEIELIEPVADTVYFDWLNEHGPGIHHLAFALENPYDRVIEQSKQKNGKEPWICAQGLNGRMDFSFLDMRDEIGLIVECYKNPREGKPTLDYDQVIPIKNDF